MHVTPHETTYILSSYQNFHGHQFKIVTLEYAPFSCYTKVEEDEDSYEMHNHGHKGGKRGSRLKLKDCVDTRMLHAMATSLNFTYVVREPNDGQWGYRLQNGSYTGETYTQRSFREISSPFARYGSQGLVPITVRTTPSLHLTHLPLNILLSTISFHRFQSLIGIQIISIFISLSIIFYADFSLNVAFTGDRERVIDYTLGYYNDPLTFCTSPPRPLPRVLALVRPFHPEARLTYGQLNTRIDGNSLSVWTGFVVAVVAVGSLYYGARKLESSSSSVTSFLPTFLKIYGSCLTQSQRWEAGTVGRAVAGGWILFSLVMFRSYVAMLTASLALPPLSPTINTLQELVDSDFSWGIQDQGAADYQLLKTSTVPLYRQVYRGLQVCPNLDACLARARDYRYAFITWRLYMQDRIAIKFTSTTGEPQLHVATSDFFPSEIGWAMTPGCPFRNKFNQQIRRLLEAGLLTRWLNQLIHDPGRRETQESDEPQQAKMSQQPLTLDHVQGAYYVLFIGYAVSGPLFLLELACFSLYHLS
ncbi:uncharacterized protein LOC123514136 [Portunus trituberculatus]|uniref:uncharacterized protein LOC123514136 n=1 Tax=Portunus trituberculatus TaxID=210409 RepID=UPI001E1D0B6B|nr:uncharacterized protein LOC123514136 [Portunus trituberculatus]